MIQALSRFFFIFPLFIGLFACNKSEELLNFAKIATGNKSQYIFLGHTYHKSNRVDPRLEKIDFSSYKGVWLGGDLCAETTKEKATLDYLDQLFDLSQEETHWAVGNHDVRNGNLQWIKEATNRDLFYACSTDGLTVAVMDTNLGHVEGRGSTCEAQVEQATFFHHFLDTLQNTKQLVILMHWVIWGETETGMQCEALANNCLSTFQFTCEGGLSRFPNFLYPKLVNLEQRGIEVVVVSGDGGIYTKQYHYQTKEGIDFLISGIYARLDRNNPPKDVVVNLNPDSVLIFNHNIESQQLSWEFVNLDELIAE